MWYSVARLLRQEKEVWGAGVSQNRQYWVVLNMVKGIGAVRLRALFNAFGDAQSA